MSDTKKPSRRDFIKTSTAVAAGASLAGGLSLARSAHGAGDDVIKVALIGAGGRGTGAVIQQMNSDKGVKLVAIADAFESRANSACQKISKQHGVRGNVPKDRIFVGLDGYKDALKTDADLVVLATPPGFRPPMYEAAVKAGKQIFMEKPCCVDAAGYTKLLKANKLADDKGLMVGVGLQRRHEPRYMDTVKRLQDGSIGDIPFTRVYWNGQGIWNRLREEGMSELQYQVHNWYHFCWICGDNICEQHIHNLDVGNWIRGDEHPVEANGMGGCTARYLGDLKGTGQIFDHHFVEFTYADGTKMYSQCRHMKNTFGSVSEAAHGCKGTSQVDKGRIAVGDDKWETAEKGVSGHQQEQTDILAALRAGERYNEGHYGATSSMTAVFGREANYSGKAIKWDDLVAKGADLAPDDMNWDSKAPVQKDENGDYPIPMPGIYKAY